MTFRFAVYIIICCVAVFVTVVLRFCSFFVFFSQHIINVECVFLTMASVDYPSSSVFFRCVFYGFFFYHLW